MKNALLGGALALALMGGAAWAQQTPEEEGTDVEVQVEEGTDVDVKVQGEEPATGGSGEDETLIQEEPATEDESLNMEGEEGFEAEPPPDEGIGGAGETDQPVMQEEPTLEPQMEPMEEPQAEPMGESDQQTVIIEEQEQPMVAEKQDKNDARGVTVLLGGGVEGYTGELAPQINAGPAWGVGVALKPWNSVGLELGYTGASNSVERPEADIVTDADIIRHGGQALATVGVGAPAFQPYLLGGIEIDRYNVRNTQGENLQDDTSGAVPVGLGFRSHLGDFTADLRGQYGILFDQEFAPGVRDTDEAGQGDTPTGRYGATLRLGATF